MLAFSQEEVERCKRKDLLEEILREMAGEFPSLHKIFVDERDQYMAYCLHQLLRQAKDRRRAAVQHFESPNGNITVAYFLIPFFARIFIFRLCRSCRHCWCSGNRSRAWNYRKLVEAFKQRFCLA